jgi:hypothetical protein
MKRNEMNNTTKIRRVLFAHSGPREFTIESADPGSEYRPIGKIKLLAVNEQKRLWYAEAPCGKRLLVTDGKLNAFTDAWEAADFLVRWHNRELEDYRPAADLSGVLA